ncbi:hypothetical protein [Bifidobacterium oedipodis]|uniref:Uncharacterized protein n=1 Tax=Bifidobacterium oedipodis TaxID=2675322 RepID=A0A7Y0EP71_9BIFI|nr:hypothetical protein [Bifidobacterium sp. DSM 109957]NMM93882.1 hypothetical protein [Bifidobacterium sp. DSM 109957]
MVFASGVPVNGVCVIGGCGEPEVAVGLCRRHYDLTRYYGMPFAPMMQRMCPWCHEWFAPGRVTRVYCSERCRVAYCRARKANPADYPLRPKTTLFSSRKEPVPEKPPMRVESFTDGQVVEKCNGLCARCGRRVDLNASGVDGPLFCWKVPLDVSREATLANRILVHVGCGGAKP